MGAAGHYNCDFQSDCIPVLKWKTYNYSKSAYDCEPGFVLHLSCKCDRGMKG
jgi:hypothetical protein